MAVLCVLGLVLSALGLTWSLRRYQQIEFLPVEGVEGADGGEPVNWLLVGSDSREGIDPSDPNAGVFIGEAVGGKRTDTIIVARVDQQRQTIDLLSVPRDLWVPIAGTGSEGRVNSAFNGDGGEARLVATVEGYLGIEINNYAEIDFVGFQAVIDSLGGVPMWFDTPVRDPASGLDIATAGCHNLDGFGALAFARSRSLQYHDGSAWRSDPTGDLGRTARQQYLLGRVAATAQTRLDPTELGTIDRVVQSAGQHLVMDDGTGLNDLLSLARTFSAVGSGAISRHALPVSGFRTSGGAAVLALQVEEAQPTLELFRQRRPEPEPAVAAPVAADVDRGSFRVDVKNGARVAGIARSTAEALGAAGFVIGDIGNAEGVDQTVIRYPTALEGAAGAVGAALVVAPRYEVDESLTRIELIIGPDLAAASVSGGVAAEATTTTAAPAAAEPEPDSNEVGVVPSGPPEGVECGA